MKLVTFDEGRVGRLEGEDIVVLEVPTMREMGPRIPLRRLGTPEAAEPSDHCRETSCSRMPHPRSPTA